MDVGFPSPGYLALLGGVLQPSVDDDLKYVFTVKLCDDRIYIKI